MDKQRLIFAGLALLLIVSLGVTGVNAADLTLSSGNAAETQILVQAIRILLEEHLGLELTFRTLGRKTPVVF
ncbi:MAG: hypothetical protein GX335_07800 [Firmicutes bacterium]|nr:hypothetical protein [Bacillota bacterium]